MRCSYVTARSPLDSTLAAAAQLEQRVVGWRRFSVEERGVGDASADVLEHSMAPMQRDGEGRLHGTASVRTRGSPRASRPRATGMPHVRGFLRRGAGSPSIWGSCVIYLWCESASVSLARERVIKHI